MLVASLEKTTTRTMPSKIIHYDALQAILNKKRGKKILAHCHGVFDLLHIGHIKHFQSAKKKSDILVVTITTDRFVNKGPGRPYFSALLRAEAIAALDCVDYVVMNDYPTAVEAIQRIKPN